MSSTRIKFDPINKAIGFLYSTLDHSLNIYSSDQNLPLRSLKKLTENYTREDRLEDSREVLADLFFCNETYKKEKWQKAIDFLCDDSKYPAVLIAKDLSEIYRAGKNPLELISRSDQTEDIEDPDLLDKVSQPMTGSRHATDDEQNILENLETLDLPDNAKNLAMQYQDSSQIFGDLLVLIDKTIQLEKEIKRKETQAKAEFDDFLEPCKIFARELKEKLSNRFIDIIEKLRGALKRGTDIWDQTYQQLQDLLMAQFPVIVKDEILNGKEIVALMKDRLK